jgi:hypothetical protein
VKIIKDEVYEPRRRIGQIIFPWIWVGELDQQTARANRIGELIQSRSTYDNMWIIQNSLVEPENAKR